MQKNFLALIRPLLIVFILINGLLFSLQAAMAKNGIDIDVILVANLLLCFFSVLNVFFQSRNVNTAKPNAVVRGVMAGMMLKFLALAIAFIIYIIQAGKNRSAKAIFISMGVYVIYAFLEARITTRLKSKS